MSRTLFTSESVSEGHPDKVCDQISDAILDAFLTKDPNARVACETTVTTGMVLVCGEITSSIYVDIPKVVRATIKEIGYTGDASGGFDADTCAVITSIDEQSADIAGGVDAAQEVRGNTEPLSDSDRYDQIGAGDQGLMFGYANNETDAYMPLAIQASHQLMQRMAELRKNGQMAYLRPDAKAQVTIEYVDGKPARVDTIVISTQHAPDIDGNEDNAFIQARIAKDVKELVINPVFASFSVQPDATTRYFINPSGRFVIGGPQGDSGLTGRKIIVDTYGGYARHGGGAFSGKDPTKVDRSAAYAARHAAKNIVAAGLASQCEIQVSYAIGVAHPMSIHVNTFGTGAASGLSDQQIADIVGKIFDLRPLAIIETLDLKRIPAQRNGRFYQNLAAYGHMGRTELDIPWERLDKVAAIQAEAKNLAGSLATV
ncbi:MAG: methionine adenosyltransferase [Vampirovibrionales bacterium]|nr:methionine adenosyltransferase [Vampirovibrionales bacterium]